MENSVRKKAFTDSIKKSRLIFLLLFVVVAVNLLVFVLYRLPLEPFIYSVILSLIIGIATFIIVYSHEYKQAEKRSRLLSGIYTEWKSFEADNTYAEADYCDMIHLLGEKIEQLTVDYSSEHKDMLDYYTAWVHQIKTPIAVMRMRLGIEDSDFSRAMSAELFRIEQYVDMVLQYIRLGSTSNDLKFSEYDLDELVRETIHKFSQQIILRKLRLDYGGTDIKVITDKKWFSVILDQLFSNAVKYTPGGTISIKVTEDRRLIVSDTGIGIAPEDVPRIFEKGYTGNNGRIEKRSSGLGLYLCKQAADKLSINIKCESILGEGTSFILELNKEKQLF